MFGTDARLEKSKENATILGNISLLVNLEEKDHQFQELGIFKDEQKEKIGHEDCDKSHCELRDPDQIYAELLGKRSHHRTDLNTMNRY